MKKMFIILLVLISCKTDYYSVRSKEQGIMVLNKRLKKIKSVPYIPKLSGDSIFWVIVKEGKHALPLLIEQISDTTQTTIPVPNFGGNYTIGDISNTIIQEIIINIPVLALVEGELNNGYGNYWLFIRKDYSNRLIYQKKILNWYKNNQSSLIWIDDNLEYKTSQTWAFPNNKHPAKGYFKVKK